MSTEAEEETPQTEEEQKEVLFAQDGVGPLLQRDYRGVIRNAQCTPEQLIRLLLEEFPRFSDPEWARFWREEGASGPLREGEDLNVHIRAKGDCQVRLVNVGERSLTLRTLEGHAEAGRITFGAYHEDDYLVFHIRSRARESNLPILVGFLLLGMGIQTQIWTNFIQRVAASCGQLEGEVQVETREVVDSPADVGGLDTPTLVA